MSVLLDWVRVEQDFGAGWVDISADVLVKSVRWIRGNDSSDPLDRISNIGTLDFDVRNDSRNSTATLGAYSPGHASVRAGFDLGMPTRLRVSYMGSPFTLFTGRVSSINPTPGLRRAPRTSVTVSDWVEEAASAPARKAVIQLNKRYDEIVASLMTLVPVQPTATSLAAGISTFTFALDQVSETGRVWEEMKRAVMSELAYLYVKADGTLVGENRTARISPTPVATFVDTMSGLIVARSRQDLMNRVSMTVHPRTVGPTATQVLYQMPSRLRISPGETITFDGTYTDPSNRASRVGGKDMHPLLMGVDFTFSANSDGTGTDLTAAIVTTGTILGSRAPHFNITNSGPAPGYLSLQCRGRGLFDFNAMDMVSENVASQVAHGLNDAGADMSFESSTAIGQGAADWIRTIWGEAVTLVYRMHVEPNASHSLMSDCLAHGEIGKCISVQEAVTGTNGTFVINGVEGALTGPKSFRTSYPLVKADMSALWVLGDAIRGVLGTTTKLGFI